jgi:hypothetical protein
MKTYHKINELEEEIQRKYSKLYNVIVVIDGADGIGKTKIAKQLAVTLGFIHLEVDSFIDKNKGSYLNHIHYEKLKSAIKNELLKFRGIIVDGICMQNIVEQISLQPTLSIYIKRMRTLDNHIWWADADRLISNLVPEEYLRKSWQEAKEFRQLMGEEVSDCDPLTDSITKDLYTYHYYYRPHERSNIIYENIFEKHPTDGAA